MARATSAMLELGTQMPDFELSDTVSGRRVSSDELSGAPTVVAFICNHCPYVKHIQAELAEIGRYCQAQGVRMVAISSNDPSAYPADAPEKMAEEAARAGYVFPYLHDATQDVAKSFRAVCTPEFYVFGRGGLLVYRGQFDDSRPGNGKPVTGRDLRAAIDAAAQDAEAPREQHPSMGCSIKWKGGVAPQYT